jgi:chromosomal replication initiation ATPase DnaA
MGIEDIIESVNKRDKHYSSSVEWYVRKAYRRGVREGLIPKEENGRDINECKVADAVCSVFEISREQLRQATRKRTVVDARRVFIHYCYPFARSQRVLSEYLLGISRSTVATHQKTYAELYETNKAFRTKANQVKHLLYNNESDNQR